MMHYRDYDPAFPSTIRMMCGQVEPYDVWKRYSSQTSLQWTSDQGAVTCQECVFRLREYTYKRRCRMQYRNYVHNGHPRWLVEKVIDLVLHVQYHKEDWHRYHLVMSLFDRMHKPPMRMSDNYRLFLLSQPK